MQNPFDEILGAPVAVTEEILKEYEKKGSFSELAFNLYKEARSVIYVCACIHIGTDPEKPRIPRDQAICVGLIARITKFMLAVIQLSAETDRGEVVMALERCIMESATNLRYLICKNSKKIYDEFVLSGLGPAREQYGIITENIKSRNGEVLPIEKRMLKSIAKLCKASGIQIEEVPLRHREWGDGMRDRVKAIGEASVYYVSAQRFLSHAVHGTWVDILVHHVTEEWESSNLVGFSPRLDFAPVDERSFGPNALYALKGADAYLKTFFKEMLEVKQLIDRIADLSQRIIRVGQADELLLQKQRALESE